MKKIVSLTFFVFLLIFLFELLQAKEEKTGKMENDTLIDQKFGYRLNVLSNWKVKFEKEPSLIRSTLIKKNYAVDKSSTQIEEEILIPTIVLFADTTSLSLPELENSLIKGKGVFRNKDEYLMKLEILTNYELISTANIALDSVPGKVYGYKKSYLRNVIDPSARYGPGASTTVTKEDYFIGEVVVLKKGNNLYIIQLAGERE
ncbi:MAG: hypothetical protein Q8N71_03720, partial [candidate division Zixibacteria bacterium]|nr:hypothetical protein [candidate division Zixibacteria bacterium]